MKGNMFARRISHGITTALIGTLALFGLMACGGGGSGDGGTQTSSVTSSGAITAMGSIFVNGVEFETEGAELEMENEQLETLGPDDSQLQVGMIVLVEGAQNRQTRTGNAARIVVEDNVEGPIASVTTSSSGLAKTLIVLGQTVTVEQGVTVFDNSGTLNFDNLASGQIVEVSGFPRTDGSIQATFIQQKAVGGIFEVKGEVANLNVTPNTFTIGALTVSFSGAVAGLSDGALVEVKGTSLDLSGALIATSIEVRGAGLDDALEVEVEGAVAELDTLAQTFVINGQLVDFSSATFRGGLEADLVDGARVEAEGPISGGTMLADKVIFKESVRIEGNVASVTGDTIAMAGFPTLSFAADDVVTRFVNGITPATLAAEDEVKLRARQNGSTFVITRLERIAQTPSNVTTLQGPVSAIDGTIITILGIAIDTATIQEVDNNGGGFNFEIEDSPVNRNAFLAALNVGDIVKARARLNGGILEWEEAEIEIED